VYAETAFVLLYDANWVRGSRQPDVLFVRAERLEAYRAETPDHADRPLVLVPDLVVEVISANDNYSEVEEKVDRYLGDGVQLVWVVDPRRQVVTVHGQHTYQKLTVQDALTAGEVIPGFSLPVADIFQ
jgi:Uma2 family endonuclease